MIKADGLERSEDFIEGWGQENVEVAMLTLQDCIDYCEQNYNLTEAEIDAIAAHEHIPEMLAAELADYLLAGPEGVPRIKRLIVEDIESCRACGDRRREATLMLALKHFVETHPEAERIG